MSKILIFSDIHIHMHKSQLSRLEDCLKALTWVFNTAKERNIKIIVFAGDLFQDRQKIHTISYDKTFKIIQEYCKQNPDAVLYLLVGNHDMWFHESWDISSVGPLGAINNVNIINKPCSIDVTSNFTMDFLPYTKNPIEDIKKHFTSKNDVLISHCSVDGAKLNSVYGTKAEVSVEYEGDMTKVDTKVFSGWKRVFLGHYHCAQKISKEVEYIGSPLELNFSEAHQQKHIIVFDIESLDAEYIVNDFSPKHLIIKEEDITKHDLKGNFVQVLVEDISSTNIINMKKNSKNDGYATFEVREKDKKEGITEEEKKEIKEKLNFKGDVLEEWIKAKGYDDMKFDKLLKIGQDIVRKAS